MTKEERKEYNKKYNELNKEEIKKRNIEYYKNNKEEVKKRHVNNYNLNPEKIKISYQKYKNSNKEKIKEGSKHYRKNNKIKVNEATKKWQKENKNRIREYSNNYVKTRRKIDPLFGLSVKIRTTIANSFKRNGFSKKIKSNAILGCSFEELKQHLESKFESWMTWDNRGKYNGKPNFGWDIDHIIPLSIAKIENDIIKLNHHTNLQPLCSYINRNIKKTKHDN